MARFANAKAPFIRQSDVPGKDTKGIMRDFKIGLIPIMLFAWYKNGIMVYAAGDCTFLEMMYPLFFILIAGLLALLMEAIFFYLTNPEARTFKGSRSYLQTSYGFIPGVILAFLLPLYTPIWVLIFGVFMATIVGKMLFGGFGYNIFNPAIIGYLAITFTLSGVVLAAGGVFNPSEVMIDAYGGATPLTLLSSTRTIDYSVLVTPYGSLWDFFFGTIPGSMGETSALVILGCYIWFVARKVIKWSTPLIYIGTVFLLTWLIGIVNGETGLWFPLYGILSGGLMYGAVFMATEPVTTPRNPLGKIFFALFLGALTVLFRYIGVFPEGVATAIIVMNIFTMPIDRSTAVIRSSGLNKKTIVPFLILIGLLIGLMVYAVLKSMNLYHLSVLMIGGLF